MNRTQDIVARLWSLCHILRDDGITFHQYVTELTYMLFLKMLKETGNEAQLPDGYRWGDLEGRDGVEQLAFYRAMLAHLGNEGQGRVKDIFANASTTLRQAKNLNKLVRDIDALDWYDAKTEGLGDLYEGLLQRNAEEKKSGAGQYFTPRPLIDCMVALVDPRAGELVQDPALGTGGFLIAADRHIKARSESRMSLRSSGARFVSGRGSEAIGRTSRRFGPSWSRALAMSSAALAPWTSPSRRLLEASRLAPWSPELVASPAAQRPGSEVRPSSSMVTPPTM